MFQVYSLEQFMGASGHSSGFSAFYESFFGDPYMAWHDGLDTGSLARLRGKECDEAERLLINALDSGDYRPAAGLAVLRSKAATAKLKEQLPTTSGDRRLQVARALRHSEKYAPAVDAVIDELQHNPFWGSRMSAAIALREMSTPAGVAALQWALSDPQDLVRHHAAASLLVMYGIQRAYSWKDNPLTTDIMSDDQAGQEKAIAEIEKLLRDRSKIEMDET